MFADSFAAPSSPTSSNTKSKGATNATGRIKFLSKETVAGVGAEKDVDDEEALDEGGITIEPFNMDQELDDGLENEIKTTRYA